MIRPICAENNRYNPSDFISGDRDLIRTPLRYLPALLFSLSGAANAIGLGDLKGAAIIGEGLALEVEILGVEKKSVDSTCFRLYPPADRDSGLPWLKQASLSVRAGDPLVLEIRSAAAVREPVFQIALEVICGFDTRREYLVMASPPSNPAMPRPVATLPADMQRPSAVVIETAARRQRPESRLAPPEAEKIPLTAPSEKSARKSVTPPAPLRLLVQASGAGDSRLRIDSNFRGPVEGTQEARRDLLRLEFRMLLALNDQVGTQLTAAEKLRNMEVSLGELQQKAADFAERIEKNLPVGPSVSTVDKNATIGEAGGSAATGRTVEAGVVKSAEPVVAPVVRPESQLEQDVGDDFPWFGLIGGAGGILLAMAAWFGWRRYKQWQEDKGDYPVDVATEIADDDANDDVPPVEPVVFDRPRAVVKPVFAAPPPAMSVAPPANTSGESSIPEKSFVPERPLAPVIETDLPLEPRQDMAPVTLVDIQLDQDDRVEPLNITISPSPSFDMVPPLELSAQASPDLDVGEGDGGPAVNPVIELAEIMLSFGRFKGAAQTLQDYVDANPLESVEPWCRLLEVYRMAEMRDEFEKAARELNRYFNVAVQPWEEMGLISADSAGGLSLVVSEPAIRSLEDIPRLMTTIVELWKDGDVISFLDQLLRDNRGGERMGFPIEVVQEIVLLLQVKELTNQK